VKLKTVNFGTVHEDIGGDACTEEKEMAMRKSKSATRIPLNSSKDLSKNNRTSIDEF
jgi:hypothetical protein